MRGRCANADGFAYDESMASRWLDSWGETRGGIDEETYQTYQKPGLPTSSQQLGCLRWHSEPVTLRVGLDHDVAGWQAELMAAAGEGIVAVEV